jgi:hypothetical protein
MKTLSGNPPGPCPVNTRECRVRLELRKNGESKHRSKQQSCETGQIRMFPGATELNAT